MNIALLLEQGSTASSVATTLDMLRLAQRLQPGCGWRPHLLSTRGGLVRLTDEMVVETAALPADLDDYQAIILPGFFADSMEAIADCLDATWLGVIARLRRLPADRVVAASCYGTFVMAEAGLLDGVPATTTWWLADAFRLRYPQVMLDADRALVDSGRAITAGAMTAHTDLALHVLRRLGGAALARRVAGIMLVDGARTSQRPFMSVQRDYSEPLVRRAIDWMAKHIAESFAIEGLAGAMHVSYRTLNRRFVEVTGMGPLAYLQALKIERAKELLEESRASLETITAGVGYEDASSFRRLFKRATGLSPAQYRRQFGGLR